MELNMVFPREVKEGQKNCTPLVIVGGTVEYHGPHCSYGCDTLVEEGLVKKLAEKKDIIIAPTIAYSPLKLGGWRCNQRHSTYFRGCFRSIPL